MRGSSGGEWRTEHVGNRQWSKAAAQPSCADACPRRSPRGWRAGWERSAVRRKVASSVLCPTVFMRADSILFYIKKELHQKCWSLLLISLLGKKLEGLNSVQLEWCGIPFNLVWHVFSFSLSVLTNGSCCLYISGKATGLRLGTPSHWEIFFSVAQKVRSCLMAKVGPAMGLSWCWHLQKRLSFSYLTLIHPNQCKKSTWSTVLLRDSFVSDKRCSEGRCQNKVKSQDLQAKITLQPTVTTS